MEPRFIGGTNGFDALGVLVAVFARQHDQDKLRAFVHEDAVGSTPLALAIDHREPGGKARRYLLVDEARPIGVNHALLATDIPSKEHFGDWRQPKPDGAFRNAKLGATGEPKRGEHHPGRAQLRYATGYGRS